MLQNISQNPSPHHHYYIPVHLVIVPATFKTPVNDDSYPKETHSGYLKHQQLLITISDSDGFKVAPSTEAASVVII